MRVPHVISSIICLTLSDLHKIQNGDENGTASTCLVNAPRKCISVLKCSVNCAIARHYGKKKDNNFFKTCRKAVVPQLHQVEVKFTPVFPLF